MQIRRSSSSVCYAAKHYHKLKSQCDRKLSNMSTITTKTISQDQYLIYKKMKKQEKSHVVVQAAVLYTELVCRCDNLHTRQCQEAILLTANRQGCQSSRILKCIVQCIKKRIALPPETARCAPSSSNHGITRSGHQKCSARTPTSSPNHAAARPYRDLPNLKKRHSKAPTITSSRRRKKMG